MTIPDIVEAHCYVVITGKQILMSIFVACSQLTKAYVAKASCNRLLLIDGLILLRLCLLRFIWQ